MKNWEENISLNNAEDRVFELLRPAVTHLSTDRRISSWKDLDYSQQLARDIWPLPATRDREGYYDSDHFSYWASGLLDAQMLLDAARELGIVTPTAYLDLGCASGRVTRHTALLMPSMKTFGCDINRLHVEWCNAYLPPGVTTFQNTSIPCLPLETSSIDIVTAFSVFTHIEALETAWLMEIRRILRPGGIAWITVHSEGTLSEMTPQWPLWRPVMEHPLASQLFDTEKREFAGNRLVVRWHADRSYSSNVFYKESYLLKHWGRILEVAAFRRRHPSYQDVIVLRKP